MRYLLYFLLLVFVGSLLTGVTQVRPGERAVVRRFGRVLDYKPGPGLWIGLPWGLDQVERVQVDHVRRVTVGFEPSEEDTAAPAGQILTGDQNLVNVQVAIDYVIKEEEVEKYLLQKDRVDSLIARAAETVIAEWVAGRTVDYVLLNGKADLPQRLVPERDSKMWDLGLEQRLQAYGLGIDVKSASVALLAPPEQVRGDFEKVNQAQTEMQTLKYRAEQDRSVLLGEAESERVKVLREAEAFAEEQRHLARTDAVSFEKRLAEYRRFQGPKSEYLRELWLTAIKRAYTRMLEKGGRIEPLDKLIGRDGVDIMQVPFGK